jgi:hypothetical protein
MLYRLERLANELLRAIDRMDTQQWLLISVVAIAVGAFFMRGYGSRTSY